MDPKDYPMKKATSKVNGYPRVHDPDHPLANKGGSVYVHRHVASVKIGRWLGQDEQVHHKDGDRSNNAPENIEVVDAAKHLQIHSADWSESGQRRNTTRNYYNHKCPLCGSTFVCAKKRRTYCSYKCASFSSRKVEHPTKEQLRSDIDSMSWLAIGRKYGVSDNAVRKWARNHGII
jgi:predicted RNA-binding Zn-ribbon protein involved in translation (DUF1610 family)